MPVINTVDFWSRLPLVVTHGGSPVLDPPALEDEDNIVTALMQSGRINSISLTVTSSFQAKFSIFKKRFLELENRVLLSRDSLQLTLQSYFQGHTRLRTVHLALVVFPSILQCISSSRLLVDIKLRLLEISNMENFSPGDFADALYGTPQLESLSLHLPSIIFAIPPSSGERVLLPALTRLSLRGSSGYLEGLVARIDAPCLKDVEITFFDKHIFDIPKLREFIDRIEIQKSHGRADILSSERAISISLTQPEASSCLKLQVLCKALRLQPLFMTRICTFFSAFLLRVQDLRISTTRPSGTQDRRNCEKWLEIIRRFEGAKWFYATGEHSTDVVRALQLSDERREPVLLSLHKLCIQEPEPCCAPLREAVVSFIHSCWLSGHFITVVYEKPLNNRLPGTGMAYAECQHPHTNLF